MGTFAAGGMVGGLMSGWLADKLGRKGALLLNNLFLLIAVALMTSAKYVGVYYLFTAGRLVVGFACGKSSTMRVLNRTSKFRSGYRPSANVPDGSVSDQPARHARQRSPADGHRLDTGRAVSRAPVHLGHRDVMAADIWYV